MTTEGNQYIVVEIPGQSRRDLVETVEAAGPAAVPRRGHERRRRRRSRPPPRAQRAGPVAEPTPVDLARRRACCCPSETAEPDRDGHAKPTKKATGKNRPPFLLADDSTTADPSGTATPDRHAPAPTGTACPTDGARRPTDRPTAPTPAPAHRRPADLDGQPRREVRGGLQRLLLRHPPPRRLRRRPRDRQDRPRRRPGLPLVTCDDQGRSSCCPSAMVEGTDLDDASAGIPQSDVNWVVNLDFNGHGTDKFAEISRALYGTEKQFAIVLDGNVISAPTHERHHHQRPGRRSAATSTRRPPRAWPPACATAPCRSRSRRTPPSRPSAPRSPATSSPPASSRA